jgi:hypothetical protein
METNPKNLRAEALENNHTTKYFGGTQRLFHDKGLHALYVNIDPWTKLTQKILTLNKQETLILNKYRREHKGLTR